MPNKHDRTLHRSLLLSALSLGLASPTFADTRETVPNWQLPEFHESTAFVQPDTQDEIHWSEYGLPDLSIAWKEGDRMMLLLAEQCTSEQCLRIFADAIRDHPATVSPEVFVMLKPDSDGHTAIQAVASALTSLRHDIKVKALIDRNDPPWESQARHIRAGNTVALLTAAKGDVQ